MANFVKYGKGFFLDRVDSGPINFAEFKKDLDKLREGGSSLVYPGLFLNFRANSRSYIFAVLLSAIILLVFYVFGGVRGLSSGSNFQISHTPSHAALVLMPKRITLIDEDNTTSHISFAKTPREFFQNEAVFLGDNDTVYPSLDSPLADLNPEITVKRAKRVILVDNNKEFIRVGVFETVGDLVGDSLDYLDILNGRGVDTSRKINDGDRILLETKVFQRGIASWYGPGFQGRTTANGEIYDMHKISAAHKTLPFGTKVRVINVSNGKSVILEINDRGPYVEPRIIDLSFAAKEKIGMRDLSYIWIEVLEYPESS